MLLDLCGHRLGDSAIRSIARLTWLANFEAADLLRSKYQSNVSFVFRSRFRVKFDALSGHSQAWPIYVDVLPPKAQP